MTACTPSFLLSTPASLAADKMLRELENVYLHALSGRRHGIPGFVAATRKDLLALTLQRLERSGYDTSFAPKTFVLPDQRSAWLASYPSNAPPHPWIVKPPSESCGEGIILCKTVAAVDEATATIGGDSQVVSQYISSPMLLHGHKFDLRLYAVVVKDAMNKPMKAYLHTKLGLARFATTKYSGSNLADVTAHLTNYSINVHSTSFIEETRGREHQHGAYDHTANAAYESNPEIPYQNGPNDCLPLDAHKWSLPRVMEALGGSGTDLMQEVAGILGKVVAAADVDVMKDSGNAMERVMGRFELIGVDVMLDEDGKAWLLEVQDRPSTLPTSDLDLQVKGGVVRDLKELLGGGQGQEVVTGAAWVECEWGDAAEATRRAKEDEEDDELRLKLHGLDEQMQFEATLLKGAVRDDGMWNS